MPIAVKCSCKASYSLKDEYAGKVLRCPDCGSPLEVGDAPPPSAPVPSMVSVPAERARPTQAAIDPAFDRNKFLLKQKIAVSEKYFVHDEHGQALLFVERPALVGRRLMAIGSVVVAVMVWSALMGSMVDAVGKGVFGALLTLVMMVGYIPVALAAFLVFEPKRHVSFYRNEYKNERLIEVEQDQKWQFLEGTFTVWDAQGNVLAKLRNNNLFDFVRKRWYWGDAAGRRVCIVKEDSILLSLLRRVLGPLFGLLRTNFVFMKGERVIGEFNRKMTILDQYVLDLSADTGRTLDRRVALAIGVMLDTGERR